MAARLSGTVKSWFMCRICLLAYLLYIEVLDLCGLVVANIDRQHTVKVGKAVTRL